MAILCPIQGRLNEQKYAIWSGCKEKMNNDKALTYHQKPKKATQYYNKKSCWLRRMVLEKRVLERKSVLRSKLIRGC